MKKYLKPIITESIVIVGGAFVKMGSNADLWYILSLIFGTLIVLVPAFLWYKDKINM